MRKISLLTVALLTAFSFRASAEDEQIKNNDKKAYYTLKLGLASVDTDGYLLGEKIEDSNLSLSFSIGRKFGFFRPEFEIYHSSITSSVFNTETRSGYASWNGGTPQPYTGTGRIEYSADVRNTAFMLNFLFDIPTGTPFTPYLGMGAGLTYNKLELGEEGIINSNIGKVSIDYSDDFDKFSFAYQAMIGVNYEIKDNIEFDAGYRYMNFGKVEDDLIGLKAKANVYTLGIKVGF